MTALKVAIDLSDLYESTASEGGLVARLIDTEIMPLVRDPLNEADIVGISDRFADVIDKVRGAAKKTGSDQIRTLVAMMKAALAAYVKKTHDAMTARGIFHDAVMGGGDAMLTVTAAAILANALCGHHAKQAQSLMQCIAKRLSGPQRRMHENASGGAVGTGAIAAVEMGQKKKKPKTDSIFAEGDVVPFGRPKPPEAPPPRDSAWSDDDQLPPDIKDISKRFGSMVKYGSSNVVPMHQEAEPEPDPSAMSPGEMTRMVAANAGWKHIDTERYPSGEIAVFQPPGRYGSANYLYIYPGGEWKYANIKGGAGGLEGFLVDHVRSARNFESKERLSWNDIQDLPATLDLMEQIARRGRPQPIDGVLVDPTTAELVLSVHRGMTAEEARDYEGRPLSEMILIAEQMVEEGLMNIMLEEC